MANILILGFDSFNPEFKKLIPEFYNSIDKFKFKENHNFEEDLFIRGWSKILGGPISKECTLSYNRPKLDGTYNRTSSVNSKSYREENLIHFANRNNKPIGLFGFPTILPLEKIKKGYFFGAPGGGIDPSGEISQDAIFPSEYYDIIRNKSTWEVRCSALEVKNEEEFFKYLTEDLIQNIEAFKKISSISNLTEEYIFEGIMIRSFDTLCGQYYDNIKNYIDGQSPLKSNLKNFFQLLDQKLCELITDINPNTIIITTDHGVTRMNGNINLNMILKDLGYQQRIINNSNSIFSKIASVKKLYKSLYRVKNILFPNRSFINKLGFDGRTAKAFAYRYIPGIYINDNRFGNLIQNEKKNDLIDKIINDFNKTYPRLNAKKTMQGLEDHLTENFPDIWINIPEGFYPENSGDYTVEELHRTNQNYAIDQWQSTKAKTSLVQFYSSNEDNTNLFNRIIKTDYSLIGLNLFLRELLK